MKKMCFSSLVLALHTLLLLSSFLSPVLSQNPNSDSKNDAYTNELKTYIVQVRLPDDVALGDRDEGRRIWYRSFLPETTSAAGGGSESRLIHSYSEVFSGFAANLTQEEVDIMSKKEGFIRAHPDRILTLATTHTASFLGLKMGPASIWNSSLFGAGVIIGLLDTGLVPGHPSFDDAGVPPPPAKWKGFCRVQKGSCNNKLIGAKDMTHGLAGTLDGHGTHTASTAAGNFVANASAFGLGRGVAAGMAPHAHIAMYRVCAIGGCLASDILAGMDAAVDDGVDILSLSLSGQSISLDNDVIAIGSLAAVEKGIFVSCAAGNNGPAPGTVHNEAPWVLTVAASTVDRSFRATIKLGNGEILYGESLDQDGGFRSNALPMFYSNASNCEDFSGVDIKGKVVVCNYDPFYGPYKIAKAVESAGGAAMILVKSKEEGHTIIAMRFNFTVVQVSFTDGFRMSTYASSVPAGNPTASIFFNGTVLGTSPAPVIAFFSSRGPSRLTPSILKPDITGPGLNIIAAWPSSPGEEFNGAANNFYIDSGTSMSTPHLSGIAALLKTMHPDWSPAAIKSAIMTTSSILDGDKNPIKDEQYNKAGFFLMGSGHVNPVKASDPGLIYDLEFNDYMGYICWKFGDKGAKSFLHKHKVDCKDVKNITEAQLNYPSIMVAPLGDDYVATINRTVTNVGEPADSTYTAKVEMPEKVSVTVSPPSLKFSRLNEKKSFSLTISIRHSSSINGYVEGSLWWISKEHVVRSPIIIST